MLGQLQLDIDIAENKIRFIKAVIAAEIEVHKMKKVELEERLAVDEYMKHNDSFDYLIKIPIYNLTTDKVEELENECVKCKDEYDAIAKKTLADMWLDDIKVLETAYDKYVVIRNDKMSVVAKKTVTKK